MSIITLLGKWQALHRLRESGHNKHHPTGNAHGMALIRRFTTPRNAAAARA